MHLGSSKPDSDLALQRLITDSWKRASRGWLDRQRRERTIEYAVAIAFLLAAAAMALLIDSPQRLEPGVAIALLVTYAIAARVEFDTGSGYTRPTELVLIPMLFLLPTAAVPLFVGAALVASEVPRCLRGRGRTARMLITVGDAWHAVGPALVLLAAGATTPTWADWPVYVGALAAQFAVDFGATIIRVHLGLGVPIRALAQELRAIQLVDLMLAPVGLLAAFASVEWELAFLLVLPLIALIEIFSHEREARIENALTLNSAYRGTAHLLGELLSTSHEYTGQHSRSVVVLAHQVGRVLDLGERTLREIEFGALLHDVGKMSVPNEIINKPGKLTDEEWAVMKRHTIEGEEMLDRIGGVLAEVGAVVRSHHERYDGTGYPDGLRGEQIPIASRVITACDSFNAMTTDRPYRAAMSIDEAIAELRDNAGTQFDPEVVEAVVLVVEEWRTEEADGGSAAGKQLASDPQPVAG